MRFRVGDLVCPKDAIQALECRRQAKDSSFGSVSFPWKVLGVLDGGSVLMFEEHGFAMYSQRFKLHSHNFDGKSLEDYL